MMRQRDYFPPEAVDLDAEERAIQRAGIIAFIATIMAFAGVYLGLDHLVESH